MRGPGVAGRLIGFRYPLQPSFLGSGGFQPSFLGSGGF